MSLFHHHKWNEVGRKCHSSTRIVEHIGNMRGNELPYDIQKMVFGYTIIELKCETCGDIKIKEIIGEI